MNQKVLYICSDVRSGSTLIDMLLARHSNLAGVGELHHLYDYLNSQYFNYKTSEDFCTCKLKVSDCPFWDSIIKKYKTKYGDISKVKTRYSKINNTFLSYAFKFFIGFVPINLFNLLKRKFKKFERDFDILENKFKIYSIINEVQNSEYVVDSSKSPETTRLSLLKHKSDIKIIFLKRDLRAIAFSKNSRRPERISLIGSAFQTLVFNILFNLYIINVPASNKIVIRYEHLAKFPKENLKKILDLISAKFEDEIFNDEYNVVYHNLGGSPHRFTNRSFSKFKVDERWKSETSKINRLFLNFILWLPNKLNGY